MPGDEPLVLKQKAVTKNSLLGTTYILMSYSPCGNFCKSKLYFFQSHGKIKRLHIQRTNVNIQAMLMFYFWNTYQTASFLANCF